MNLIIYALEQRAEGTSYVPGAYLQADMKDCVILRMVAASVDVICKVNGQSGRFVSE